MDLIAVGVPHRLGGSGGFDLWPIVGLLFGLYVGYRSVLPFRALTIAGAGIAGALFLPPLVRNHGVPVALLVTAVLWIFASVPRRTSSDEDGSPV